MATARGLWQTARRWLKMSPIDEVTPKKKLTGRDVASHQRAMADSLFDSLVRYQSPRPLWPYLLANVFGFYTGIVAAAVIEQSYKEAYWEKHPGEAVPLMRPAVYFGKYPMRREDFKGE